MAPVPVLEKLKENRNTIKINIGIMETVAKGNSVNPLNLARAIKHIATSEGINEKMMENYERIIAAADPADLPPFTAEYESMFARILEVMCVFEDIKSDLIKHAPPPPSPAPEIKLPRMELPHFSGNLQQWSSFRDIFKSTVHDNVSISKAQKLSYLKSTLSGEAARLIQSLSLTDASYDIAWNQLSDRYQNDRELLFHILRQLFQQPHVQQQSGSSLRSLIDNTKECIRSLTALGRPVDTWDDVIVYQMCRKLDQTSRKTWEQSLKDSSIPTLSSLIEFLESRARALVAATTSSNHRQQVPKHEAQAAARRVNHVHQVQSSQSCIACSTGEHPLYRCQKFTSMPSQERLELVRKNFLCYNCLRSGHSSTQCNSKSTCQKCQRKHNTLIHTDKLEFPKDNARNNATPATVKSMHTSGDAAVSQIMLATAIVNVQNPLAPSNQQQLVRAMKDGCSESSFISEQCVHRLGLTKRRADIEITGVGGVTLGKTKGITTILISPHFNNNITIPVECFILPKITGTMPEQPSDPTVWPHLQGLQLADPQYYEPASIDILLGAGVFWYHLLDGRRIGPPDSPVALRSTFGWLVAGNVNSVSNRVKVHYTALDLDQRLQQFWEIESVPATRTMTREEQLCESHFATTHRRDDRGIFTVTLPYKIPQPALGSSRDMAARRLQQLERRFMKIPDRQGEYIQFMDDYLRLGHMKLVPAIEINNPSC